MRISSSICIKTFTVLLLLGLFNTAFGDVFTLLPGSTFTQAGDLKVDFDVGGTHVTGSGNVEAQAPGSLSATLTGTVEASVVGSTLNFTGGTLNVNDTGNWQPTGLSGTLGSTTTVPFSGPGGSASFKFVGAFRGLQGNITGSASLSGAPGNQTFDTSGLAFNTTGGIGDIQLFVCTPTCTDLGTESGPVAGPPADILLTGTGTLTGSGSLRTLSLPISFNTIFNFSEDVPFPDAPGGVIEVTFSGTDIGTGNIVAAVIPEPSRWLLLLIGVGGIAAMCRVVRREGALANS